MRKILLIILITVLTGCITKAEVYKSYSKGGHPSGKSELKRKHIKVGFTN